MFCCVWVWGQGEVEIEKKRGDTILFMCVWTMHFTHHKIHQHSIYFGSCFHITDLLSIPAESCLKLCSSTCASRYVRSQTSKETDLCLHLIFTLASCDIHNKLVNAKYIFIIEILLFVSSGGDGILWQTVILQWLKHRLAQTAHSAQRSMAAMANPDFRYIDKRYKNLRVLVT